MIHGVGVDIVEIDRIRDSVKNFGEDFLERVYTAGEVEYCMKRRDPHPSLAARFAAKEALIKAITTQVSIPLKDIEVAIAESGKPFIFPSAHLKEIMDSLCISGAYLSLSHERHYAVAQIVLETY